MLDNLLLKFNLDVFMFGLCNDFEVFFKDILKGLGYVYLGVVLY